MSVVLATYNRNESLTRLLSQLAYQSLPRESYEIIVVDDGSERAVEEGLTLVDGLRIIRQPNSGAAAARHTGVLAACGEIVVVTDDDMQLPSDFLDAHCAYHPPGVRRVVVGRIRSSSRVEEMPLFERFHAELLERWSARELHGDAICTGNLSFLRTDYLAVGGFDTSLPRAEDIDLGLRLEQSGVEVVYARDAYTIHESDHLDFARWRQQAVTYGACAIRIALKHPRLVQADPWRYFFGNALAKRPLVCAALLLPSLGAWIADIAELTALTSDRLGFERFGIRLTSLVWDLEFFRGVRAQAGGLRGAAHSCATFLEKVEAGPTRVAGVGRLTLRLGRWFRARLTSSNRAAASPASRS